MTKTWGALLALPTAIALGLGGLAVTAVPASARPAPVASAPAPDATAPSPSEEVTDGGAPTQEAPVEEVPMQEAPVEEVPVGAGAAFEAEATEEVPVELEAADEVADAAADVADAEADAADPLVLTSPAVGEVRRDLELRIEGVSPGAESVEYSTSDPRVRGGQVGGVPRFAFEAGLPWDVAPTLTVTVRSLDAAGVELGRIERVVTIDVPTSPAVSITSPATGSVLLADVLDRGPDAGPTTPEWGWFRVTGTGVPGQYLALGLEALDLDSDYGTDGPNVRVGADGRWSLDIARPFGTWRVRVAQFGLEDVRQEDGFTLGRVTSRLSPYASIDVRLVPTQAAPPVAAPVVAPVATSAVPTTLVPAARPAARPAPSRSALASTGSADGTGDALLVGSLLAGLGAAAVALGRRRASGRRAQEAAGR